MSRLAGMSHLCRVVFAPLEGGGVPAPIIDEIIALIEGWEKTLPEKLCADGWLARPEFAGVTVLDPDGWDRSDLDKSWAEPITQAEMEKRICNSTVIITPSSPLSPQRVFETANIKPKG